MEKITVLNPFSVSLQKYPFMEVPKKPVYSNGDYKIYAYFERHYVHTFKNIVIAERGKANTDISPVWNDVELAKKIGKRTCYDYSGLTLTVWYKGEPKSWNDYNRA